jgi:hypothetical protein
MLEQVLSVAVVLGVGGLGFLLRGYFASYASEKGKNLATKQDVAQITSQVESVKASIQTLSHLKTDYERQRREWLLSFYDSAVEMLYEKFNMNFGDMPFDDGRSLFEFQQSYGALMASMLKQYQRIVLYFKHEDPLKASAADVVTAALGARPVFKKRFSGLKSTLLEEAEAFKSGDRQRYHEAVDKSDEAAKAYWNEMSPAVLAFQEALQRYLTHVNQFLREGGPPDSGWHAGQVGT